MPYQESKQNTFIKNLKRGVLSKKNNLFIKPYQESKKGALIKEPYQKYKKGALSKKVPYQNKYFIKKPYQESKKGALIKEPYQRSKKRLIKLV